MNCVNSINELLRALRLEARERRPVAVREFRGPVRPAAFAVFLFQQGIERVVAQPVIFFLAEFFKFIGHLTIPAAFEAREGERAEPRAYLRRSGEVCGAPGRNGAAVELRLRREAVLKEQLGADERRISCEGRRAAVRRVAEDGKHRRERKQLPQGEAGLFEKLREPPRARSEIARAVRAGQRGDVQQNPASSTDRQNSTPPSINIQKPLYYKAKARTMRPRRENSGKLKARNSPGLCVSFYSSSGFSTTQPSGGSVSSAE